MSDNRVSREQNQKKRSQDRETPRSHAALPSRSAHSTEWILEGEAAVGGESNKVLISTTPFLIGRQPSSHLSIANRTVSGRHAELCFDNGELQVRDHGSTNGTFVNGKRVSGQAAVSDGDILHFGKVRFHVLRKRDSCPRATISFDAQGDALAHLQFACLWEGDGLTPFFQPIVRLADQKILAFEALARSPVPGLENPFAMFQIAKQHNAEADLSSLLRHVSLEFARPLWPDYTIYLNTHPAEMGRRELFESLDELRAQFPEAPMVLEVHEAGVASMRFLSDLKLKLTELNVKLAYDDFGTGQSRLIALAEVSPDIVKFDIELIRGLQNASAKRKRMIRSLLKIVKALNAVSVAEGVEEPLEAAVCHELGFELAQGYFFGRPAPIHAWVKAAKPVEETHKVH